MCRAVMLSLPEEIFRFGIMEGITSTRNERVITLKIDVRVLREVTVMTSSGFNLIGLKDDEDIA